MYQLYAVQKFNGKPYNVLLGSKFETIRAAQEMADLYEFHFGKCEKFVCEPAGNEIPTAPEKKKTLKEKIMDLIK